jgi:DNA mismatch repair protein MutH
MDKVFTTKEEVLTAGKVALHKTLRDFMTEAEAEKVEAKLKSYGTNRKGFFGQLIEEYIFQQKNNSRAEADFLMAGVELKSTPIKKHEKKEYVSKERLVFSMINYDKIILERWESSTFLQKNKLLLLMFYLFEMDKSLVDYEFKFVHLLNLLDDISVQDVEQIRKDWEFIVEKIRRGEAHLLSEGDTFYLGACTKAMNSSVLRDQPSSRVKAKPRAFSLKQTYLNYILQKNILGRPVDAEGSLYKNAKATETIEEIVDRKFRPYFGKNDKEIVEQLGWKTTEHPKSYKRLLANRILTGTGSNNVVELEKANITLKAVTLDKKGNLVESISFPAFDYKNLVKQVWYDEKQETMSDFHAQLESKKFLFVVFQKQKNSENIILKKVKFWNFPASDLGEAEKVFDKTIDCINEGRYKDLPKMSENPVAHVRPHGRNKLDTQITPQGTKEPKKCFWLNAKYIQKVLET